MGRPRKRTAGLLAGCRGLTVLRGRFPSPDRGARNSANRSPDPPIASAEIHAGFLPFCAADWERWSGSIRDRFRCRSRRAPGN